MAVVTRKRGAEKSNFQSLIKPDSGVTAQTVLELASSSGINSHPLDVDRVIRAYGVGLKRRPMSDNISGKLSADENGWTITVNSLHHPNRQRFTLAHELAHYLLHSDKMSEFTDETLFRNNETNPIEAQANKFAAELLMPEDEFRNHVRHISSQVDKISEHFGVSPLAVRVRAKQLGFSGHGL